MYANDEEKELFATASSKTKYLAVKRDGKLYSYTKYIRIIDYGVSAFRYIILTTFWFYGI